MHVVDTKPNRWRRGTVYLAIAAVIAVAGCSGGDGDASDNIATTSAPPTPSLTLTGTAATGAAIAGATITVKCATGNGSGPTLTDGSFSISVADGVLPCVAEVTTAGGSSLHSLAVGSGLTAVVNITPVTELIVASMASVGPGVYYTNFSANSAALITSAALTAAQSAVIGILRSAGIDLSSLGDLLTAPLRARTGAGAGDAYDQALDRFAAALAAGGTTLGTFTSSIVASAAGGASSAADVASLPPAGLLQPAAANCAALRSGTYRLLTPLPNTTLEAQFGLSTINASTLAIVRSDASQGTLVANGPCRFTDTGTNYRAEIVVAPSGFLIGRYTTNGAVYRGMFGFPEQTHAVAELAGSWNLMSMEAVGSTYVASSGAAMLSAAGQLNGVTNCENDITWAVDVCANVPDSISGLLGPLVVDAKGGLDLPDAATGLVKTRAFVYASGNGVPIIATVSNIGFALWARPVAIALPPAGQRTVSWDFDLDPDLSSEPIYDSINVVDAVDATAGSYARTHGTVGLTATRPDTIFINKPRLGLIFRPGAVVTASDGRTVNVYEYTTSDSRAWP